MLNVFFKWILNGVIYKWYIVFKIEWWLKIMRKIDEIILFIDMWLKLKWDIRWIIGIWNLFFNIVGIYLINCRAVDPAIILIMMCC